MKFQFPFLPLILLLGIDVLAKVTVQGIEQGLSRPCSSFQRGFKLGDGFSTVKNPFGVRRTL